MIVLREDCFRIAFLVTLNLSAQSIIALRALITTVNKTGDSGELKVSAYQTVVIRIDTMNQSKLKHISGK